MPLADPAAASQNMAWDMPLAANSANPKPSSIPDTPTLGHAVDIFTHRRNFYVELRNWGRLPERDPDTRFITHFESSGNYHSPGYCVHNAMLHLYKALSKQLVMTTFCCPGDPYYATVEDVYFQFPGTEGEDKRLYLATLALLQQLSGFDVLSILPQYGHTVCPCSGLESGVGQSPCKEPQGHSDQPYAGAIAGQQCCL